MTLLELMMAVTVLGILLALAVPGFTTFTLQSRVTASTNDLVTALNLARSEALRRATPAVACASTDQTACSGTTDWTTGWIVFTDPNGNGAADTDELLQVWPAANALVTTAANQDRVTYNTLGMAAAATAFEVATVACKVERQVNVTVSLSGSIRSDRITCVP
jgi:type IV fimbrial biogenesis protein FimT